MALLGVEPELQHGLRKGARSAHTTLLSIPPPATQISPSSPTLTTFPSLVLNLNFETAVEGGTVRVEGAAATLTPPRGDRLRNRGAAPLRGPTALVPPVPKLLSRALPGGRVCVESVGRCGATPPATPRPCTHMSRWAGVWSRCEVSRQHGCGGFYRSPSPPSPQGHPNALLPSHGPAHWPLPPSLSHPPPLPPPPPGTLRSLYARVWRPPIPYLRRRPPADSPPHPPTPVKYMLPQHSSLFNNLGTSEVPTRTPPSTALRCWHHRLPSTCFFLPLCTLGSF